LKQLVQKNLAQGLDIPADHRSFVLFQEQRTEAWYIRNCKEIWDRGMYCSLAGYETHVFLNFQVVYDNEFGHYSQLATFLNGKGTPDIQRSLQEVFLTPLHTMFGKLLSEPVIRELYSCLKKENRRDREEIIEELQKGYTDFYEEALLYLGTGAEKEDAEAPRNRLAAWMEAALTAGSVLIAAEDRYSTEGLETYPYTPYVLLLLPFYLSLSGTKEQAGHAEQLLLEKPVSDSLRNILEQKEITSCIKILNLSAVIEPVLEKHSPLKAEKLMTSLLKHNEVTRFLRENRYNKVLYFHKESFEKLLWFLYTLSGIVDAFGGASPMAIQTKQKKLTAKVTALKRAAEKSGYATEKFIEYCRNL
jgi:hypothetical protein